MSDQPKLSPRSIDAFNRFSKDLAAFTYVLRHTKVKGPVTTPTLFALNGLILTATRLFRRHADMPRFFPVDTSTPMSLADLEIYVARLNAANAHFEERYAHLTESKAGRTRW
jgi:hypothetical protein